MCIVIPIKCHACTFLCVLFQCKRNETSNHCDLWWINTYIMFGSSEKPTTVFTLRIANHTIYESTNNDWGKNCFAFFVLFCLSGCGVRHCDGISIRQRMERERNRIHHRYTLMRLRWIQLWFEETVFYWIRNYYRVWQLLVNILFGSWFSAHEYRKWLSSSRRDVTQTGGGFPIGGSLLQICSIQPPVTDN